MTAQIPDSVRIDRVDHDLVGVHGDGLFDPADHGLAVVMASTACYRGYVCTYAVVDDQLQLDILEAMAGRYDGDDFVSNEPPLIHGHAAERIGGRGQPFNVVYRGLGLPVAFTGQLLIGAGRIDELIAEMGFAPAWTYQRVVLLGFEGGKLASREDLSAAMAATRAQRPRPAAVPALARADLAWIVESFSRGG
jgi:hypothetical protein